MKLVSVNASSGQCPWKPYMLNCRLIVAHWCRQLFICFSDRGNKITESSLDRLLYLLHTLLNVSILQRISNINLLRVVCSKLSSVIMYHHATDMPEATAFCNPDIILLAVRPLCNTKFCGDTSL